MKVKVRVRRRELAGAGDAQEKQEPHTKDVGNKNPTLRMWEIQGGRRYTDPPATYCRAT